MSTNIPYSPPPPGFVTEPASYGAPPPPPPMYQERQPTVVIVGNQQFGCESQHLTCPYCHANVTTTVRNTSNTKTHLMALLLCVLGLWCCAPCPYCMDSCLVTKHFCPSCNAYLGASDN